MMTKFKPTDYCRKAMAAAIASTIMFVATPTFAQSSYATAEEAASALVEALKMPGDTALLNVLGKSAKPLISSGDPVTDRKLREDFLAKYAVAYKLTETAPSRKVLAIGQNEWPLPIPILQSKSGWRFDSAGAREEILDRRIGNNELSAIQAIRAFADAQQDYASQDRDSDGVRQYARRFRSSPDQYDGLYWPTSVGEKPSPLGMLAASAATDGYNRHPSGKPMPYYGYYFRILDGQGKDAPGGAYSYLAGNKMIGGFAIVAYPAKYGVSGVMSFIVNQEGVVYQKNLGSRTGSVAAKMSKFNPDSSWSKL